MDFAKSVGPPKEAFVDRYKYDGGENVQITFGMDSISVSRSNNGLWSVSLGDGFCTLFQNESSAIACVKEYIARNWFH